MIITKAGLVQVDLISKSALHRACKSSYYCKDECRKRMVLGQSHFPCTPEAMHSTRTLPGAYIARQVILPQKEAGVFHSLIQLFINSSGNLLSTYLMPVPYRH